MWFGSCPPPPRAGVYAIELLKFSEGVTGDYYTLSAVSAIWFALRRLTVIGQREGSCPLIGQIGRFRVVRLCSDRKESCALILAEEGFLFSDWSEEEFLHCDWSEG